MELPVKYTPLDWKERKACREQYILRQDGLCHYCGSSLNGEPLKSVLDKHVVRRFFPDKFFDNPIHLHHNHDTDLTIGAVHAYCNAVLWQHHGE